MVQTPSLMLLADLRGARAFRTAEGKISARTQYCVEIQVYEPDLKSYFFCVDSEDILDEWVVAINGASAYVMKGKDATASLLDMC
jgi:hypothetical protein